jgi:hypothetical protein
MASKIELRIQVMGQTVCRAPGLDPLFPCFFFFNFERWRLRSCGEGFAGPDVALVIPVGEIVVHQQKDNDEHAGIV